MLPHSSTVHRHRHAGDPFFILLARDLDEKGRNAADLAWDKKEWFFTLQPEAGVLIGRDTSYGSFGLNLSARYTWLPATFGDVGNVQSFGGWIGLYSLY